MQLVRKTEALLRPRAGWRLARPRWGPAAAWAWNWGPAFPKHSRAGGTHRRPRGGWPWCTVLKKFAFLHGEENKHLKCKHPVQPLEARQAALHHPISRQGRSTLSRAQHGAQNSPFAEHDGTNEGRRRRRCLAGWPDWCRRQLRIKITRTNCPQNGAPTLA